MQASGKSMIARDLLAWYDAGARELPWRKPPGAGRQEPYRVWLSEVMLQQTTVAAVRGHYAKFLQRWPTVSTLAAAEDAEVMAAWAGLGYYARARNLLACARAVAAMGGRFPESEAELRKLPGLGDYTAAAIAAIAFDEPAAVVDANVERVVARLFAIADLLPAGRKAIRLAAREITPVTRPGDFAQAMMDLGATVCTVRSPRCLLCPLRTDCRAGAEGDPARYPVKPAKKAKPSRQGRAFWIVREGAVWLVRRPGKGMLGGMRALPDDGWSARGDGSGEAPLACEWRDAGSVRHVFTHFDLALAVAVLEGGAQPEGEGEWWPIERIGEAGLPTLFAKAAQRAMA
ncbi:MAG: A/G-specific adenine glycosylase [Sphingomonadales bacterium]|nr:A/G-specific adenine glycosylase [Sphingomonadales bacterium]MDE2568363.1 A/G-specific adenine glycosylase [Sphingomonadales bacterium]